MKQGTTLAFLRSLVMPTSSSRPPRRRALDVRAALHTGARRAGARAFTIPELLAVVIIIGIFATAASPMFVNLMRDRRVNRVAMEITGLYRMARTRALGRSNPVLVRWRDGGAGYGFEMREGVVSSSGPVLATGCFGITDFDDPNQAQRVTHIRPDVTSALADLTFFDEDGNPQGFAEMCFSARGRTFVRYVEGGAFTSLAGVPRVDVENGYTKLRRTVFIPPNGVARLAL
ncbi:MAG: prepilin-type N-terminal cleavage/methylation domain-containing protein [Polyangiaceae bacterium]|nr:prepilin-type N-terminal cleavage/methylation domain-containing protein [Polyangiaceae bacterium]